MATGNDDGDDGVWASDDIPVPDAPTGVHVPRARADAGAHTPSVTADGAPIVDGFVNTSAPPVALTGSPFWTRGKRVAVGVAAAGVLVVAAVAMSGGTDDAHGTANPGSEVELPDDSTAPESPESVADPTVTLLAADPETGVDVEPFTQGRITLPPVLSSMSVPTEVLLVSDDGVLHTVSLPSGLVRSVPVAPQRPGFGLGFVGQDIVVAPDAAALTVGDGVAIVPRTNPAATIVDGSEFPTEGFGVAGWRILQDGATVFSLVSYTGNGRPTLFDVGLDGVVETVEPIDDPTSVLVTMSAPDGRAWVNDAGGVYEVQPDGAAQRIDDGELRGVSDTSLLLRTCTAELVCGDVVLDQNTGERRAVDAGVINDALFSAGAGLDLAPDGTAVSGMVDQGGSQERVIVDLATGDEISTPTTSWSSGTRWAADSSGIFELAQDRSGVVFLDRASGEAAPFAEDLGQIVGLGVRMPDAELGPESTVTTTPITFEEGAEPPTGGIEVQALTRSGNVVEVDIDARTANVWSPMSAVVPRPSLFSFGDQVAVVSSEGASGSVSSGGVDRVLSSGLFGPGPILPGPVAGTVWTSSGSQSAGVVQELVDLDQGALAEPTRIIDVPDSALLGGDGRGGLVVLKGGDVYIATADGDATGLVRLTTGDLLALGADTAFVRECDDAATCSVFRVDRVTGTRTMLPEMLGLGGALGVDQSDPPFGLMGTAVAPGGDLAVVRIGLDDGDGWMLVDIANGPFVIVEGANGDTPFVWSDDGTSAVTLTGANLVVVDINGASNVKGLGSLRTLAPDAILASVE